MTTTPRSTTPRTSGPADRSGIVGLLAPLAAAAFTTSWIVLSSVSDGYQMWDIVVQPYSSIAQPISGLGLGSTAPWMNAAFVVCGIWISVATWSAMRSWPGERPKLLRWARPLVASTGVGMALCGLFDLESILVHTLGFVLATGVSGTGLTIAGHALRGTSWRALAMWLRLAGPAALIGMIAFLATFNASDAGNNIGYAGLVQRVLVTVVMISVGAIGLHVTRRTRPTCALRPESLTTAAASDITPPTR